MEKEDRNNNNDEKNNNNNDEKNNKQNDEIPKSEPNDKLTGLEQLAGGQTFLQEMFIKGAESKELSLNDLIAMAGGQSNLQNIFKGAGLPMPTAAKIVQPEEKIEDKKFITACFKENLQEAEEWLKKGADIDAKDRTYGYSALHSAIYENKIDIAKWLLKQGANPLRFNKHGETPLHSAAYLGNLELVLLLLSFKANPNQQENHVAQFTPLLCSIISKNENNFKVFKVLLENGGNPYLKNEKGFDSWDLAKAHGHEKILEILEEYKENNEEQKNQKKKNEDKKDEDKKDEDKKSEEKNNEEEKEKRKDEG